MDRAAEHAQPRVGLSAVLQLQERLERPRIGG